MLLLWGDLNCEHLEHFLKGDEEINLRPRVLYEGGLKVTGVTQKVDEIGDDAKQKEVEIIAMHVGSSNFPYEEHEDQEMMLGQYLQQLSEIDRKCPNAEIIVCSIPRRIEHYKSTVQKSINGQINSFNAKLRETADDSPRVHFCNTIPYLTDKDGPCPALYKSPEFDPNGVHLNDSGKKELSKAITEEIKRIMQRKPPQQQENMVEKVEEGVAQITFREKASEVLSTEGTNPSTPDTRHV